VTIVADTSPIHYAVLIGAIEALFGLYGRIVIPSAVYAEILDPGAPGELRDWVRDNPERLEVRHVHVPEDPLLRNLDAGEAEAIFLAQQTPDSLLLIDERAGRAEARRRGLRITGLLGGIRNAALLGLLDFDDTITKLKATDFRMSPEVEAIIRDQYRSGR
jgi:predicted nucleic acid-binding protein